MAKDHSASAAVTRADGAAIRELRLERALALSAAARLVGCHPKSLQHIENDYREASELMIRRIAKAYGVKPGEIRRKHAAA